LLLEVTLLTGGIDPKSFMDKVKELGGEVQRVGIQ
jgi:hypothetical protein